MTIIEKPKQIFDFGYNGTIYYYISRVKADEITLEQDENGKNKFVARFNCDRCGGVGQAGWRRANGICFKCHGLGYSTSNLVTTKNKQTAENRLKRDIETRQSNQEKARNQLLERNLKRTQDLYGDTFYLILNTKDKNTYEEREYLKSLGARWSSQFNSWFINASKVTLDKLDGFKVVDLPTKKLLTEYNTLNWIPVHKVVSQWNLLLIDGKV